MNRDEMVSRIKEKNPSRRKMYNVIINKNLIIGDIADDSLHRSLSDFTDGILSDKRLIKCIKYCGLGYQYVFKKKCAGLEFMGSTSVTQQEINEALIRKQNRRQDMNKFIRTVYRTPIKGEKFLDEMDGEGGVYVI